MMHDLDNKKELKLPKIKFTKLVWPEQEEHQARYDAYFGMDNIRENALLAAPHPNIPDKRERDLLQRKITEELTRIREVMFE